MIDQPLPAEGAWACECRRDSRAPAQFGSLYIVNGIREYCTQCGEMIFADAMGCVLNLRVGQKWLKLPFHYRCYIDWERQEPSTHTSALLAAPTDP